MKPLFLSLIVCAELLAATPTTQCDSFFTALQDCKAYVRDLEDESVILRNSIRDGQKESDAWKKEAQDERPPALPWYAYMGMGLVGGMALGYAIHR